MDVVILVYLNYALFFNIIAKPLFNCNIPFHTWATNTSHIYGLRLPETIKIQEYNYAGILRDKTTNDKLINVDTQ